MALTAGARLGSYEILARARVGGDMAAGALSLTVSV